MEYELKEYFEDIIYNYDYITEIRLFLRIFDDIINMSYIFDGCEELFSFPVDYINKEKTKDNNHIINSSRLNDFSTENSNFSNGDNSINKENFLSSSNASNFTGKSYIFNENNSLISIIQKLNTSSNFTDMSDMYYEYQSFISLPDISKWNTCDVTNISYIFNGCLSLMSLPDISKWDTSSFTTMSFMLCECQSIISLSDISKLNTINVNKMVRMLYNCKSLIFFRYIKMVYW